MGEVPSVTGCDHNYFTTWSHAAEEMDFVEVGNALLTEFQRHKFFSRDRRKGRSSQTQFTEFFSIDNIIWNFPEVIIRKKSFRSSQPAGACSAGSKNSKSEEMEKKVVCYLLGRACTRSRLKVLISDPTWMEPLCVGLIPNSSVVNLHIHFLASYLATADKQKLMANSIQHLSSLFKRRPSFRGLHFSSSNMLSGPPQMQVDFANYINQAVRMNNLHELGVDTRYEGAGLGESCSAQIAEALLENTSIKVLKIDALPCFVNCFVWQDSKAANCAVEDLTLVFTKGSDSSDIEGVLSSNQRLRRVSLLSAALTQARWLQIVESLKKNSNLEVLDIGGSTGWVDRKVLSALQEVVRTHCTQIIDFGFEDMPQDTVRVNDILRETLPALNEQLRLNSEYGQVLKYAPTGPPRSARVFLCGPGYAGKTALCKTMLGRSRSRWSHQTAMFLQRRPKLWRFLHGPDADKELDQRTRGVDMHLLKDQKDLRITLWDFAGQKEYYAMHDYMFPNVNSANLFLFTFSLVANPFDSDGEDSEARLQGIERELLFWLRFLCSNSKEVLDPKPRVVVVLTSVDRVTDADRWRFKIDEIFGKFRKMFQTRLDLAPPTILLNAHSEQMVKALETRILEDFAVMRRKLEATFTICEDVRLALGKHVSSSGSPVITMDEYDKICQQVDAIMFRGSLMKQAVASYLHNVGEIIYFRNLNFVVINPRWLGVEILGNLFDVFGISSTKISRGLMGCFQSPATSSRSGKIYLENGFVNRAGLETLLKQSLRSVTTEMGPEDLIELLSALEICFKDVDETRDGYLIPAALDDTEELAARGLRALNWHPIPQTGSRSSCRFIGRRLQCADQALTGLTPGFFPRLQVVLRKHLVDQRIIHEEGRYGHFKIDRNLLRFLHNTMDVIVEYGEGEQYRGNFVDVLVRSLHDHSKTVDFIEKHVLNVIRKFCAQPEGNQGVILVEGILRPRSVEHLVLCKYREDQALLMSDLEEKLQEDLLYRLCWNEVPDYDGRSGAVGVPEYAYALDVLRGEGFVERCRRKQTVEAKAISKVLGQLQEPVATLLENLGQRDGLLHTPKLVFLLEEKMGLHRMASERKVRMRLHLECEWKEGPHVVSEQPGRSFVVDDEVSKALTPLLEWAYHLCKLAGIAVARTVPFFGALEVGVGFLPERIPKLPSAFFDQRSMDKMGKGKREEMVRYYEEILKASPCCEWLSNFLDIQGNLGKFEADFKLKKVRYRDTKEIAFLCEECRISGFTSNILQLP